MGLSNNDVLQCSFRMSIYGQRLLIVRHLLFQGAGLQNQTIPEALEVLADGLVLNNNLDWFDKIRPALPSNLSVDSFRTQRVRPERSVMHEKIIAQGGTYGTAAKTANIAAGLTFRTAKGGRNQVSTVHFGPVPDMAYENGRLLQTYVNVLAEVGDILTQPIDFTVGLGGIMYPCILHRDGNTDIIRSHVVQNTLRTMRRRTVGVGE